MGKSKNAAAALAVAVSAALAPAAWAHAFPQSQTPAAGATLPAPPGQLTITFNAPLEPMFYRLQVLNGADAEETSGHTLLGSDHRTLAVPLKPLPPGDYTVRWAVVSEDGHRTEGSYTFTVSTAGLR